MDGQTGMFEPDEPIVPRGVRVALVHDWLVGMRGGEKVLEVVAGLFPDAPIYTLLHVPGRVSPLLESHPIRASLLQHAPWAVRTYRYYLPVMPYLVERLAIEPVDLVVSTSHCVAKGIVPPQGARHAAYIFSPMRYLYDRFADYFSAGRAGWPTRLAMGWLRQRLMTWDIHSTQRIDSLAGISSFVNQRIARIYGRSARRIFPPVEVERFRAARREPGDYYLIVSALVPYKNVDVAIEAFRRLDRRLIVAGGGPMLGRLQQCCPPNVEMLGWVDDARLPELVAGCRAFLFPAVEDFGIAPLEAMAAGRPVIALGEGGALDTVRDLDRWANGTLPGHLGPTGVFYSQNHPEALARAVERFERESAAFDPGTASLWAASFDRPRFVRELRAWLADVLDDRAAAAA